MRKVIQQLEEENVKLKKAIEVLKKQLNLSCVPSLLLQGKVCRWVMLVGIWDYVALSKEEYELLKEVLEYDK